MHLRRPDLSPHLCLLVVVMPQRDSCGGALPRVNLPGAGSHELRVPALNQPEPGVSTTVKLRNTIGEFPFDPAPERRRVMRFHTSFSLPKVVPAGHVLVHNSVRPYSGRGHPDGFHPRLLPPDTPGLVVCDCDFAPELGPHYRLERAKSA